MDVRVWGAAEDRLIEVIAVPGSPGSGLSIDGLPVDRLRSAADRVRAALLNGGALCELPPTAVRLEPGVRRGVTSQLDLPIALAVLGCSGRYEGLRWVFASGRLGLDGQVFAKYLENLVSIVTVITELRWRPE